MIKIANKNLYVDRIPKVHYILCEIHYGVSTTRLKAAWDLNLEKINIWQYLWQQEDFLPAFTQEICF